MYAFQMWYGLNLPYVLISTQFFNLVLNFLVLKFLKPILVKIMIIWSLLNPLLVSTSNQTFFYNFKNWMLNWFDPFEPNTSRVSNYKFIIVTNTIFKILYLHLQNIKNDTIPDALALRRIWRAKNIIKILIIENLFHNMLNETSFLSYTFISWLWLLKINKWIKFRKDE